MPSAVLSNETLNSLSARVQTPKYDRNKVKTGIVHIGPGAFHRAHQAAYIDDLLNAGQLDWGICEVSVNNPTVRNALEPQDYLYTLATLDRNINYRIIGAIKNMLVAPESPERVINQLCDDSVKIVTLTITEKGYCLSGSGQLDLNNQGVQHDLKNLHSPKTALGFVVAGLFKRFENGQSPYTVVSCDNLNQNGKKVRQAVLDFGAQIDAAFASWLQHVSFPCTMVDSITPATTNELKAKVETEAGIQDNWPIQREAFLQWVIEDLEDEHASVFSCAGATLSKHVEAYEAAKLKILNGTHSTMAMVGSLCGLTTVEEAINHLQLRKFIEHELTDEILPTLTPIESINYKEYSAAIIQRYENPAIRHLLAQIAWDSSQKLPIRILDTISDCIEQGTPSRNLTIAIAAWFKFLIDKYQNEEKPTDPLVDKLVTIVEQCIGDVSDVDRFLTLEDVFPSKLTESETFKTELARAYNFIGNLRGDALLQVLN